MVSSTEFQQNVGFYLKEAQKGKPVQIRKSKPEKALFVLSVQKESNSVDQKTERKTMIMKLINKLDIRDSGESGLEFQRRVRS